MLGGGSGSNDYIAMISDYDNDSRLRKLKTLLLLAGATAGKVAYKIIYEFEKIIVSK